MVAMDISTDVVKNYSKCPLKKRPVLIEQVVEVEVEVDVEVEVVLDEEQCEPENLSTKPEDLSRHSKKFEINNNQVKLCSPLNDSPPPKDYVERILVPRPTYPKRVDAPLPVIKEEINVYHSASSYTSIPDPAEYKNWNSPLTPPICYPATNENLEPVNWHHPNNYQTKIEPLHHHQQQQHHHLQPNHQYNIYCKDENVSLFKSTQVPLYNPYTSSPSSSSLDLRTTYNNNNNNNNNNTVIKTEHFANPKRFTPYRVDRPQLFNIFPLSPASSQASSYNSYESPRRSVSPVSTNSSISENLPTNYSVFQSLPMPSAPPSTQISSTTESTSKHKEKSLKNAHYQCPDCSKSYSTYSGLSKHLQFHCPAVEGNQAKKNFSCKNCDKVYTSLGALKMHIRTHTLPCKCDICGKAFSRPWLLQGHIRTHTGEKPFTCQHCHRAFADRSNLRAHLQTHSEIKKYSCTTCAKTFSRMSLLTKHMEVGCPGYQLNPHHTLGAYNLNQMGHTKSADISVY